MPAVPPSNSSTSFENTYRRANSLIALIPTPSSVNRTLPIPSTSMLTVRPFRLQCFDLDYLIMPFVDQMDGTGQTRVKGMNGAQYLQRFFRISDRSA